MQYVKQEIIDFLSSNLTPDYPLYNPSTTYTFQSTSPTSSSIVRYGAYYYRSLINGNVGFDPIEYEGSKWIKWGISNAYAMLDVSALSKSTKIGDDLTVTFAISQLVDTIGVGYYEADTVLVELLDDSSVVLWDYTVPTSLHNGVYDWYTWTYQPYEYEADKGISIKIPPNTGTKVRVTFNMYTDGTQTSCGFLVAGQSVDMGKTSSNINFKFNSYATKIMDQFGTITITKRAVQDIVDFETVIDRAIFVQKRRKIKSVYNDIIMFILDESEDSDYENLITLGVIQDATPILDEFDKSTISWSILEAI